MKLNKINCLLVISVLCLTSKATAQDSGTISVSGNGEVKLQPDKATVTIGVYMRNVDLDQVREETDTRASAIIAVLKKQNIKDKDIQSSYTSLQPHFPYIDPDTEKKEEEEEVEVEIKIDETQPDYYEAQKTITFILRNISNYDNVMAGLYDAGINSVDGVTFGLENDKKAKLEARKRAAANAKEIATVITDELGVRLSFAYSITDNTDQSQSPVFFLARAAPMAEAAMGGGGGSDSGPSIAGGEIVVTSSVSVNFYTYPLDKL